MASQGSTLFANVMLAKAVSKRKLQGPTLLDRDLLIDPFKLFINGSFCDKISQLWLDSLSIKTKNIKFISAKEF